MQITLTNFCPIISFLPVWGNSGWPSCWVNSEIGLAIHMCCYFCFCCIQIEFYITKPAAPLPKSHVPMYQFPRLPQVWGLPVTASQALEPSPQWQMYPLVSDFVSALSKSFKRGKNLTFSRCARGTFVVGCVPGCWMELEHKHLC